MECIFGIVRKNEELSPIDKFNYVNSLLKAEAARAIQGLPLTNVNYNVAIDTLRERFGKPQTIIATHIDDLLKLPTLSTNCRVKKLLSVVDN